MTKLNIPTREQFHREFAGVISSASFSTHEPLLFQHRQKTKTESDIHGMRRGNNKEPNYDLPLAI